MAAVLDSPTIAEWRAAAEEETERLDFIDELVPAAAAPLTLG